jgi:regulatory protein
MKKTYTEEEMLSRMAALCSASEHCTNEITDKLYRMEAPSAVVKRIVKRLVDEGFINEQRFAHAFVSDKYRFDRWGRLKIIQALHMKRIEDGDIRKALEQIDEEAYLNNLKELLEAKRKSVRAASDYELKGKLLRFAAGRGFEPDLVLRVLDE